MSNTLLLEYRGFIRFLTRAKDELISWYGPHCNSDASKIAFIASKEWDGMADLERKPFIRIDPKANSFFTFMIKRHYKLPEDAAANSTATKEVNSFHPHQVHTHATEWRALTRQEREGYSDVDTSELAMDYVIHKRKELHKMYEPRELNILEFMIKTKPKLPKSSRVWFLRTESQHIKSAECMKNWHYLDDDRRSLYERCAVLDSKRYALEKNAWITKIIGANLDSDDFTLSDFELTEIRYQIESLGSIVELSKDLPSLISLKRPREPFSLFIEAYQYQMREKRPYFQFGPHLKACSEAWKKLNDEEKQFYRLESKKLKEKRKKLLEFESRASGSKLSVPVELFNPNKTIFGPCRVSHLYQRVPSIYSFWAEKNNISSKPIKPLWEALDESEKNRHLADYKSLKESILKQRQQIELKHKFAKGLIRESRKLESIKRDLGLIGNSDKPVKNIYN